MNNFFKSINGEQSFEENFDFLMKGIDKSKNHLKIITDTTGHTKKVWVANEGTDTQDAGRNAGKQYEKTGKRHTSHSGFESGDDVTFLVGGKATAGTFRHVNENKHGAMAVIRGADGKLYERAVSKISKRYDKTGAKIPDSKLIKPTMSNEHIKKNKIVRADGKSGGLNDVGKRPEDTLHPNMLKYVAGHSSNKKDDKADKLKKVADIKKKSDLDHDLTLLKQEYKKVATKEEYNPMLDDKNIGDASALEVIVRQYKHKLGQKGVDISKLSLKFKPIESKVGTKTSDTPEA